MWIFYRNKDRQSEKEKKKMEYGDDERERWEGRKKNEEKIEGVIHTHREAGWIHIERGGDGNNERGDLDREKRVRQSQREEEDEDKEVEGETHRERRGRRSQRD